MKLYDEGFKAAAATVGAFQSGELEGFVADHGVSLPWLCHMAINAGAGDHLEIGTSYGASAIAVALAKKAAGIPGTVYCVDPYPGQRKAHVIDPRNQIATISAALRNIKKAEVDVQIVRHSSKPFPKELEDKTFVSSYIDGDHLGKMPAHDLAECAKRTTYYIGVDNYEEGYPDLLEAVHDFCKEEDWNLYFKNFLFVAFRRSQPPRSSLISSRMEHM